MKKYYNDKTKNEETAKALCIYRDKSCHGDEFCEQTLNYRGKVALEEIYEYCKSEDFAETFNCGYDVTEIVDIVNLEKAHVCKCCGSVVEGTEEDLLCEDCREVFGHTFFTEL